MRTTSTARWCLVWLTMVVVLFPCLGSAQTLRATDSAAPDFHVRVWGETATDFTTRIHGYFELRRRLQSGLPAMTMTNDVAQIRRETRSLAGAIRVARRGAVQGEFFTAPTSVEFKRVLALIMSTAACATVMDDNPGQFNHDIDGAYPYGKTIATTPGLVLAHLPQLPEGIEFRFLGSDLILYDVRANTIIDQLSGAIECADDDHDDDD